MQVVDDERKILLIFGQKVKVNFGTLCIKPFEHDTYYTFGPITFKLHLNVVDNERRNPFGYKSPGQRSRSALDSA